MTFLGALVVAASLGLGHSVFHSASGIEVQNNPFLLERSESGHWTIEVTINDIGPFNLAIDTGASHTALPASIIEYLLDEETVRDERSIQSLVSLFDGEVVALNSLQIGDFEASNIDTVILPIEPDAELAVDGLLGNNVFSDETLALDLRNGELLLDAPHPVNADGYILNDPSVLITQGEVRGARQPFHVLIDTGSRTTIINEALYRSISRRHMWTGLPRTRVRGVDSEAEQSARWAGILEVAMGGICRERLLVVRSDADVFRSLGWQDEPAMIAGLDVLANTALTIDYAEGVFELEPVRRRGWECRHRRVQAERPGD